MKRHEQFLVNVEQQFERAVQPMLADGGGARLLEVDPGRRTVTIALIRTYLYCPNKVRSSQELIRRLSRLMPELREISVMLQGRTAAMWKQGGDVWTCTPSPGGDGEASGASSLLGLC